MEPKDKVPSLTANADFKYKQMMNQYNQRFKKGMDPGYLDY